MASTTQFSRQSEQQLARFAGLCYLMVIGAGLFAEVFVRQALVVTNNAATTLANVQSHEQLYRLGVMADLFNFVIGLPCILIVYHLFKHTNRLLMQLAVMFVVIQTAIIAVNLLNQLTPLLIVAGESALQALTADQRAALALLALKAQVQGYGIGLIFFGFYCLIVGYVVYSSGRVPRVLGVLYAISGLGYLINSVTMLLSKGFANPVFEYLAIPIFIGELSFCLWLLIKGVRPLAGS
ncbi:MAG: DUF4386 domain-containing protein [Cyclobacteriaceae bacterium]